MLCKNGKGLEKMAKIHIKVTDDTDDKIVSELMNILIKHGYKTEKYLGKNSKLVRGEKRRQKNEK